MLKPLPTLVLLSLAGLTGAAAALQTAEAPAASAPSIAQQRARIKADRDRIEAQFAAEQAACRQRFAVTACTDDVRLRRRAALAAPRAQAMALDDLQRNERAAERREAVAEKQRRAAERPVPAPPVAAPVEAASAAHAPLAASAPRAAAGARAAASSAAATAAANAAQRAQAFKLRQAQIQQGQARIEARQAERARAHKPSPPLSTPPVPPAASMPAR